MKVPQEWHQSYCDNNAKPGTEAVVMDNYTCYLVSPRTSDDATECFSLTDKGGVQGSAVYVETKSLRDFKVGLADVQAIWAQIASLYCQLLEVSGSFFWQ